MTDNNSVFLPYCLVAAFADGARLTFQGMTEAHTKSLMEAAQALHGDITWWDCVTDQNYDHGRYYKTLPQPPEITQIDLTDYPQSN